VVAYSLLKIKAINHEGIKGEEENHNANNNSSVEHF